MKTVGAVGILLLLMACNRNDSNSTSMKEHSQVGNEAAAKRAATAALLKAMSVPTLAATLEQQSAQRVAPFNSPAFKELTSRGAAAATDLAPLLTKATPDSFLGLLALRQLDISRYRALDPGFRVAVLVDTLRGQTYFNSFGLPDTTSEPAARALIEEGAAAVAPLSALLADKRPAPVFGSEIYGEYKTHQYRVCDYALAYLMRIRGEQFVLPPEPGERDRLIGELQARPQ